MGKQDLWYIGGTLRRGKMQGDDIIFPNLDMCLITLAGWFNKNLLKKNWNPRCNFIIFEPPCSGPSRARMVQGDNDSERQ